MSVGAVLNRSLDVYQRFFWRLVVTAAVVYVALDLVRAIVASADVEREETLALLQLLSISLSIVGFFWLSGALVEAVQDVRDGKIDTTIGELFARTRPRLPSLIGAGLVAGVAILAGLLLIVPGLYLLTRWSLLTPVIVLEGRPAREAFRRSWELVQGNGWRVFAVIAVTLVATILLSGIVQQGFASLLPDFLGLWLGGLVADSLVAPFAAVAWTVMYFELSGSAIGTAASA
jgi:Membrane domain of glycerophosphoryl diester phosphodiesterase